MDGILIIDKPQGMTSHDVVSFLRRKTGIKRIGHTGTLDPMATGVLPVFIGKATRLIEYSSQPEDMEAKAYRCTMKLGLETDTQDIWGTPIEGGISTAFGNAESISELPKANEIENALKSFEGEGRQRPPMYSAVKVRGRKLYEYARKGSDIDEALIKERKIYIKHIYVNRINEQEGEVVFDVYCSKGVYIRTLCSDTGRLLGCGAVMSGLRRLKSDGFAIEDAVDFDLIRNEDVPLPPLLPLDMPLKWLTRVDLSTEAARMFIQGQKVGSEIYGFENGAMEIFVRVYNNEVFLGIGYISENEVLTPKKVLI